MVLRPSFQSGKYAPFHHSAGVSSRVGNDTSSGGGVAQHLVLRCATKAGEYGARSRVFGRGGRKRDRREGFWSGDFGKL